MNNYNCDLVGISGAAGCGKDTLAMMLSVTEGYEVYRMADPLKRGLEKMFNLHRSIWNNRKDKEAVIPDIGKSPRFLAQTLGTEWGRDIINPDLWVILAERMRAEIMKEMGRMIIPDIRFQNEAEWIKREDGVIIQILRPGQDMIPENLHKSEAGFDADLIDITIINSATKAHMLERAEKCLWDYSENTESVS